MFSSADGALAGPRPCASAAPMRPLRSAQAETSLVRRSASQSDAARGRAGEAPRVGPYFEYAASLLTTRSLRRGGGLLGSPRSGAPRGAQPGPRRRGRPRWCAIAIGGSAAGGVGGAIGGNGRVAVLGARAVADEEADRDAQKHEQQARQQPERRAAPPRRRESRELLSDRRALGRRRRGIDAHVEAPADDPHFDAVPPHAGI